MGDIKIWVLTGDKCDKAENIDLSCNLINENQKIFRIISSDNNESKIKQKNIFPEIMKFQKEFEIKKEQIKGKVKYDIDNYFGEENDKNNLELNKKNNDSNNYLSSINMKNNYLPT